MADKKRPRPSNGDEEDPQTQPNSSKRGKGEKDEEASNLVEYNEHVLRRVVGPLNKELPIVTPMAIELRFPVLSIANNGAKISDQRYQFDSMQLQSDSLLGLVGFVYAAPATHYRVSADRFEEYKYRYPEFANAYFSDAQAAAWIFYFNRAFKVHADFHKNKDGDQLTQFEFPCPPHYMTQPDEWMKRVEGVLEKHGDLKDAFPGYGYQNWPATRTPSNGGIHVRYYGTFAQYKQSETERSIAKFIYYGLVGQQPVIFKRSKKHEDRLGIMVWRKVE